MKTQVNSNGYVSDMVSLYRKKPFLMCESGGHTDYPQFHTDKYDVYNEHSEYEDYTAYGAYQDACGGSWS